MGARGFQASENDNALFLLEELEAGGAEVIRQSLTTVGGGYIDASEGSVSPHAPIRN